MPDLQEFVKSLTTIKIVYLVLVALVVGGFVLAFFGLFSVDELLKAQFSPRKPIGLAAVVLGCVLIAGGVATILYVRHGERQDSLQSLPKREDYVRATLKGVAEAKKSILMCVHTLDPAAGRSGSKPNKDVGQLQEELSKKLTEKVKVRLIAPVGLERLQASAELFRMGIPVRHVEDILYSSFSVFDSSRIVFPTAAGESQETQAGATVDSPMLAGILERTHAELWSSSDALPYDDFVRRCIEIIRKGVSPPDSLEAMARRLDIQAAELQRIAPCYGSSLPDHRVFLLIGRPCSGKTTIATTIVNELAAMSPSIREVFYYNDYQALYELFLDDTYSSSFRKGDHDGFEVKTMSVLDSVLTQASVRIRLAAPLHRVCMAEFARGSYANSIAKFDESILKKATVVHVTCSLDTCLSRNRQRNSVSVGHKSGHVPESVLHQVYKHEDLDGVQALIPRDVFTIDTDQTGLGELTAAVRDLLAASLA